MSTVNEATEQLFKQVRIDRNSLMMAAHFYDIHIGKDGIHAYFMWRRNNMRFPIWHHLMDFLTRRGRGGKTIDAAVGEDERNVYVPFADIQGLVTYRDHKEIQLLSVSEQIYILFRNFDKYDDFVALLKEKVPDKYFTRDDIDIPDAVYIS